MQEGDSRILYLCIAELIAFAHKIHGGFPEGKEPSKGLAQSDMLAPRLTPD